MSANTDAEAQAAVRLHRVLGTMDLALFSIAAIVSLRILSIAAQVGPSSLTLWVVGLITFFLPLGLAILELSSRIPGQGGLYLWARAAFGDMHGFVAGWSYMTCNFVYFPSLLLGGAGSFVYVGGADWLWLADSPLYNGAFCLGALWFATALNIAGLERAKWLSDFSGIATWLVAAALMVAGAIAWFRSGTATPITAANIVPDFTSLATFASFSAIALAYVGLELGPLMGGEIKDPRRTIPRAVVLAGIVIAVIYVAGTLALLVALPAHTIDAINGIPQALASVGEMAHIPAFGSITALLIGLAAIGGLSAWLAGTARLPFVFGIDRYLPSAMGKLHPKYGTPYLALLMQSIVATVFLLLAISGSAIHEAFTMLVDMTIILSLAPLLYIFAALPVLRWRARGNNEGVWLIPGGLFGCTVVGVLGFAVTLLAIVVAMIPPQGADPLPFFFKAVGGCAVIAGVGLVFFLRARSRSHSP